MPIDIDEGDLKAGVLGLVVALVEIIRDVLRIEAFKRMDGGSLTSDECERLGKALMDLDLAIEGIKEEQGLGSAVAAVRSGLDDVVRDLVDSMVNPDAWQRQMSIQGV